MLWTSKYAPQKIDDVAGNDETKATVKKWALEWNRGKRQKPLLLSGPSGVGKTALARAVASEFGWILVETGSSEVRTGEGLQRQFGETGSQGLFGKRLFLIDDLDSVFDRGQSGALTQLLENAVQPVILCANDVWNPKLAKIRELCVRAELKRINKTAVKAVLSQIASTEKTGALDLLETVASESEGDLRGAIIDFQSGFSSEREREEDVFKSLLGVFKGDFKRALETDPADYDIFLLWIEENIPIEYEDAADIAEAFSWLSKANVFKGRIFKRQDYGLKRYERALALGGVAASKSREYRKFSRYQFPGILRLLSKTKGNRAILKQASLKAAALLHCSSKQALETLMAMPEKTIEAMGFEEDEKAILEELKT